MDDDDVTINLQKLMETFMRRSMHKFIFYAKERGLSMSQIGALFAIRRKGTCGVSDIGDELGITPAATSQMLNRLVDENLIERSEDPGDRRVKRLVLTQIGTQTLQDSIHARLDWLTRLANTLNPEEKAQVNASLHLLLEKATLLDDEFHREVVA
ncbi:MAG: MarR family transcriptional regulator [Anaerolineales bacterium]|nr:MarR family transcriptional regulator [Anaerolineales bacterium]